MEIGSNELRKMILALSATGLGATALAGDRTPYRTVTVDPANRYAAGQLGGARNSADTLQQIGCGVSITASTGDNRFGYCSAVTATGLSAYCWTFDVQFIEIMRSLPGDALVQFNWNANGSCSQLSTRQFSNLEPKR